MALRVGFIPAACAALALLAFGSSAEARGGGARGGGGHAFAHGGGFAYRGPAQGGFGHRGFAQRGFGHRHGFHRHGRFGHAGRGYGYGYGYGAMPWGGGYGYGPGYYDVRRAEPDRPLVGIPPSPILPPALYVIGGKSGRDVRKSGPVVRKGRADRSLSAGSGTGSSAVVVTRRDPDRRHRMN